MIFEWDEQKNRSNIRKHGIDFADIHDMFEKPMLVGLDDKAEYDEDRWIGIGLLTNIIVVIVFTEEKEGLIRIISARKAAKHEIEIYEKKIWNQMEKIADDEG